MDGRRGQRRLLQGQALDGLAQRVGEAPLAPVASPLAGQPGESLAAILGGPASGRAEGEAPVAGHAGQGDPLFQGGTEELEPLEGSGTLGLREAAERRLRHRPGDSSGNVATASQPGRRSDEPFIGRWCQIAPKKPCQIAALPHSRWRQCQSEPKQRRIPSKTGGLLCEFAAADHQKCGRTQIPDN